ncbi:hypothetical protein JB92DRAFT_3133866 [Gautieria morchelliformis]|nr:hypothetical protein JB92DRAFT_3133866 [Gautieria morchelliformis]
MAVHVIYIAKGMHERLSRGSSVAAKLKDFVIELKRIPRESVKCNPEVFHKGFPLSLQSAPDWRRNGIMYQKARGKLTRRSESLRGYSEAQDTKIFNYRIGLTVHRPQTVANSQHIPLWTCHQTLKIGQTADPPLRAEACSSKPLSGGNKSYRIPCRRRQASIAYLPLSADTQDCPESGGNVKCIQPTYFIGGLGDIYSGFLQDGQGSERVALSLPRGRSEKPHRKGKDGHTLTYDRFFQVD